MKLRNLILFAAACALTPLATAQARPTPVSMISLQASMTQLDVKGSNWKTNWGSFAKYQASSRVLEIKTSSLGDGPEDAELHVFFIGRNDSTKRWALYDYQRKPIKVGRRADSTHVIVSGVIESSHERYNALDLEYREGLKPHGWALFVAQPKGMVAKLGSTPEAVEWTLKFLKENPDFLKPKDATPK